MVIGDWGLVSGEWRVGISDWLLVNCGWGRDKS